jgi:hypothetical protein
MKIFVLNVGETQTKREKMENNFKIALISVGVICLLMGTLIGVGISMIPEGKCIRNPLYYGISSFEGGDLKVMCSCFFNNPLYPKFFFNSTGVFNYDNQN